MYSTCIYDSAKVEPDGGAGWIPGLILWYTDCVNSGTAQLPKCLVRIRVYSLKLWTFFWGHGEWEQPLVICNFFFPLASSTAGCILLGILTPTSPTPSPLSHSFASFLNQRWHIIGDNCGR